MSSQLAIRFGDDMPAAAVEVVSPNLEAVTRVMLTAGRSRSVDLPSEACFLRVHLPSGRVVTLTDPDQLAREITLETIAAHGRLRGWQPLSAPGDSAPGVSAAEPEPADETTLAAVHRTHRIETRSGSSIGPRVTDLPLATYATARLLDHTGAPVTGGDVGRGDEAHWDVAGPPQQPPLILDIAQPSGERLELRLPGNVRRISARAEAVGDQSNISFSVRLSTAEPAADAILGYLQRGDLRSAEVMTEWVSEARVMLRERMDDPYAACAAAYQLLRLRAFREMQDWARNLAERFPSIPDGSVIWATQLQHETPNDVSGIRKYLLQAADRGLPIYTEGLRLLVDGLRLLGAEGNDAHQELRARAGAVLWSSPITASIHASPDYSREKARLVNYDIVFAAKA